MVSRPRTLVFASILVTIAAASGFAFGERHTHGADEAAPATDGRAAAATRAEIVEEVKAQIAAEMGLVPVSVMRARRASFVELYAYDSLGKTHYGTAGYLGHGYFITVKHAVVGMSEDGRIPATPIDAVKIVYHNEEIPAKVVDTGDANVEVHRGDWAIIRSRDVDLPPLLVDTAFTFDFAEPIFRLGNDYSRGIILSSGYVGQRLENGLVTCLIDGHPGVSGGGVLDKRGRLVGIPIGRLDGDYRFSFLLPLRAEMLRKVPELSQPAQG